MTDTPTPSAAPPSLRDLVDEAIVLRHKLYYGISFETAPELSDAANRLGAVLAKLERQIVDRGLE